MTTDTGLREWRLDLPRLKPLNLNQQQHWAPKAKMKKALREAANWLAKAQRIPFLGRCEVWLHYAPPDRRKRDAENITETLKALCDGLVDAGLCVDDTPDLMTKHMPVIEPPVKGGAMWLVIRELEAS